MSSADIEGLIATQKASFERAGSGLRASWPRERSMDAAALAEFLSSRRYAVLATTRPDGRAHAAPVAFLFAQGAFWIATVEGARLRNLRHHPYASIVIMEGEGDNHRALLAEGDVALHQESAQLQSLWTERVGSPPDWAAAFIELRPNRVFSYAAS
ncbi:MAG: pyridoxamine 5'-phosphate oxidase family protein [Actinomycetota bacterium]